MVPAAAAGLEVTIAPAADWRADALPYAPAEMTIDNSAGAVAQIIQAAAARCADGGPTFVYPLAVAPGAKHALRVTLPVVSLIQDVDIRLLAGVAVNSPVLAERRVTVRWPEELMGATGHGLIDLSAYQAWEREHSLPAWPAATKRTVFLILVLAAVAAAGALLIPKAPLRLAVVAVVVAAAAVGAMAPLRATPNVRATELGFEPLAETRPAPQKLLAVTCLRTTEWHSDDAGLIPLYRGPEQMAADDMIVAPGRRIAVTLRPGDVRLFRVP